MRTIKTIVLKHFGWDKRQDDAFETIQSMLYDAIMLACLKLSSIPCTHTSPSHRYWSEIFNRILIEQFSFERSKQMYEALACIPGKIISSELSRATVEKKRYTHLRIFNK